MVLTLVLAPDAAEDGVLAGLVVRHWTAEIYSFLSLVLKVDLGHVSLRSTGTTFLVPFSPHCDIVLGTSCVRIASCSQVFRQVPRTLSG